jgi:hypothetical protein
MSETGDCIKKKHGVWEGRLVGVDYNSSYLIVNSVASYPTPLQYTWKGVGVGKITFVSVC